MAAGPPISEDPAYQPFFKMTKMGVPAQAVKNKMQAAGLNPDLLDTPDAPASAASSSAAPASAPAPAPAPAPSAAAPASGGGLQLKDDPVYALYFRMLKTGVPEGAVALKMQAAGLDASVLS